MMSQNNKRKTGYVDRAQILSGSRKLPNILPDTIALPCIRNRKYSFACKFKHRLSVPLNKFALDAIVLENDICVLISKFPIDQPGVIEFSSRLHTEEVSGRMKKGALNLKAGATICTVTTKDGSSVELVTPVGGKLLELNDSLISQPLLVQDKHDSEGYFAIIYPDTEIPTLDGYSDYKSLTESFAAKNVGKGVCFDFAQLGGCKRGDSCKFKHKTTPT